MPAASPSASPPDRRFRRRDPLSRTRVRSRSRRIGQSLCGAVRAQGRTFSGRRRAERSNSAAADGASPAPTAPSSRAKLWWRWVRGRIRCLVRSDIRSRSRSSAAITCTLAPRGNAVLNHPVLDSDSGFLLAPMNRGIRLTTGVEFARRDAPPTPVPGRARVAAGARAVSTGRGGRRQALDGRAALPARHAAGDRQGAAPRRAVVRFRPPASRPDAGPRHRPPAGGNDDRRDAVRRSKAVRGRTFRLDHIRAEDGYEGAFVRIRSLASRAQSRRYCRPFFVLLARASRIAIEEQT